MSPRGIYHTNKMKLEIVLSLPPSPLLFQTLCEALFFDFNAATEVSKFTPCLRYRSSETRDESQLRDKFTDQKWVNVTCACGSSWKPPPIRCTWEKTPNTHSLTHTFDEYLNEITCWNGTCSRLMSPGSRTTNWKVGNVVAIAYGTLTPKDRCALLSWREHVPSVHG